MSVVSKKRRRPQKKKPYLPLKVFLVKKRAVREDKKKFRLERRKRKVETQRLLEKAQRMERRLAHLQKMERKLQHAAVKGVKGVK